jgi:alanyl aminopeptidase
LLDDVVPLRYELELEVDPRKSRFSGTVTVSVRLEKASRFVVLHGQDLAVSSVTAALAGRAIKGRAVHRPFGAPHAEILLLFFDEELPQGEARLTVRYDAPFSEGHLGLVHVKEGGRWYGFTNFEPSGARRLFPCFDEPARRAPFEMTVTAPSDMVVLANMPEASRAPSATGTRFKFQPTPPISTYLVALIVGEFVIDQGAREPVPIRLVRAKGKSGDAKGTLDAATGLLDALGRYFDYPYPFPKMDLVALPQFFHGAMENPGLVTFHEDILLPPKGENSVYARRQTISTVAHELAHQWVGDLVTHAWWQEVWLSEGLATFVASKAIDAFRPGHGARLEELAWAQASMNDTVSLRPRVDSTLSAENLLYTQTRTKYAKAGALFAMFERYLGRPTFERAMRRYVRDYAWKAASFDDFVGLLENESGKELRLLAKSFLGGADLRLLTVEPQCESGEARAITVRQEAYIFLPPAGEVPKFDSAIGFCFSASAPMGTVCRALTEAATSISLGGQAIKCSAWIDPDPDLAGYYRYVVTKGALERAAAEGPQLNEEAKLGLIYNAWSSVRQGRLDPAALLRFIASLGGEPNAEILEAFDWLIEYLDVVFVEPETEEAFRAFVTRLMAEKKRPLGLDIPGALVPWRANRGDDDEDALVRGRRVVVKLLGRAGDRRILGAAEQAANDALLDPAVPMDPDLGDLIWPIAELGSDSGLFDAMFARATDSSLPAERRFQLSRLASFDDKGRLMAALELLLGPDAKSSSKVAEEIEQFLWTATKRAGPRKVVFDWIDAHWDDLRKAWPARTFGTVAMLLRRACRDEQRAMLEKRLSTLDPPVSLDEDRRRAQICSDARKFGLASFTAFLQSQKAAP